MATSAELYERAIRDAEELIIEAIDVKKATIKEATWQGRITILSLKRSVEIFIKLRDAGVEFPGMDEHGRAT